MIAGRSTVLVGREAELRLLWERVPASVGGGLGVVVVRGPAGIGKSRLLEAFVGRAREFGAAVIAGRSQAVGSLPYGAIADALAGYCRTSVPAAVQLRRAGEALVRLVPSLASMESLEPGDLDRLATVQAAIRLLRSIIERRPVVIVIDDVHAADAESCELLAALARQCADLPWTLVLGWRDPSADTGSVPREMLQRLRRDHPVTEIPLGPFEPELTATFLAALLGDGLPSESLVEMLQHRTAGNAYYLEEMLRWLKTTGHLQRVGVLWVADEAADTDLPPTIEETLNARLGELPEDARGLIQWLAVAGGSADLGLLETLSSLSPTDVANGLERLATAGLVVDRGGRPPVYAVGHPLVAECAYASLGSARRRLAHRAIAGVLAPRNAAPEVIATHLTRAADPGDREALAAALEAGQQAEKQHQYTRAITWYGQALEIVAGGDRELRLEVLDRISEVAPYACAIDSGRAAIAELLDAAPADDRLRRATLLRRLAQLYGVVGDDQRVKALVEEGLGLASEAGPEAAALLTELAMSALIMLSIDEASSIIQRGRRVAAAAVPPAHMAANALAAIDSMMLSLRGYPSDGLRDAITAGRQAMDDGDVVPFGFAMYMVGVANLCMGRCRDTVSSMSALSETFTNDMGLMWGAVWGWALHGEASNFLGELDNALQSCLRGEDIGRRHGALAALSHAMTVGAMTLVLRDQRGAASARLREARELLDTHHNVIAEGWYWYVTALLAEADDDLDGAIAAHERMWQLATARGHLWVVFMRADLVHLLIRAGRAAEALPLARALVDDVAHREYPLATATVDAAWAAAVVASGEVRSGGEETARALASADALDMTLVQAWSRLRIGSAAALAGAPGAAIPLLHDAQERFEVMGAAWPVALASQGLRALGVAPRVVRSAHDAARPRDPLDLLSEREREVVRLAAQGSSSRAIALRLCISERTVENHLQKTYSKLGVHSRAQLIAMVAGTGARMPEQAAR